MLLLIICLAKINNRYEAEKITRQKTAYGKYFSQMNELRNFLSLKIITNKKVFLKEAGKYHFTIIFSPFRGCQMHGSDNKSQECLENHCQHSHEKVWKEQEVKEEERGEIREVTFTIQKN